MDRKDILKRFLNAGIQLDKAALEYFVNNEEDINPFLEKINTINQKPKIVTLSTIEDVFSSLNFKITKLKCQEKNKISINDLTKSLIQKYRLIKTILEKRGSLKGLVSINKITPNTKEFSIIAMIVSVDDGLITVEDLTGQLTLQLNVKDEILPDDVVGLLCEQKSGKFLVKEIIWPDIPLKREIKKLKKKVTCIFLGSEKSNLNIELKNSVIFTFGKKRKLKSKNIIFLDPDYLLTVAEIDDINIIILSKNLIEKYKKYWKEKEVVVNLLKRRDMNPIQEIQKFTKFCILTSVPDIVVFPSNRTTAMNYKGTTILSISDNSGYFIDLSTREVKKL